MTNTPLFTNLLIEEVHEQAQVNKPTALGTPLRYSGAHGCSRQWGYYAFDAEPTEPVDAAGAWVMGVGTLVHEKVQEAISRAYPHARFEVASGLSDKVSGSCDALITDTPLGTVLYELKTMGTYSFDKQVGWNRMRSQITDGEGPKPGAIAQAGLNALGLEETFGIVVDYVVLGSITFEALSKPKAFKMGVDDIDRVLAEWHFSREEWLPLAQEEASRMLEAADSIEQGYLPPRFAVTDSGTESELDPFGKDWQCGYCAFRTVCVQDGRGQVWINDSALTKKETV